MLILASRLPALIPVLSTVGIHKLHLPAFAKGLQRGPGKLDDEIAVPGLNAAAIEFSQGKGISFVRQKREPFAGRDLLHHEPGFSQFLLRRMVMELENPHGALECDFRHPRADIQLAADHAESRALATDRRHERRLGIRSDARREEGGQEQQEDRETHDMRRWWRRAS